MGRAYVVCVPELLDKIDASGKAFVIWAKTFCSQTHIARVSSPLLPAGENGVQDIILEADGGVRFKRDCDV